LNFLRRWWYARLRRIDLDILWPSCKEQARDLDMARAAFACHAFNDEAWMFLGEDTVIEEIGKLR
jgi:hypothetical protein